MFYESYYSKFVALIREIILCRNIMEKINLQNKGEKKKTLHHISRFRPTTRITPPNIKNDEKLREFLYYSNGSYIFLYLLS